MDVRRLELLLLLSRHGSMRSVADVTGATTSTVSQQLAVLAREAGVLLLEPRGRRVVLTPAGRRLAQHAAGILAAVEAARRDLDPGAQPAGTVRVAGFATAVRRSLLPVSTRLEAGSAAVRLRIHEHEPAEALDLLRDDQVDLALVYDYNLAPAPYAQGLCVTPLWSTAWSLGVPADVRAVPGIQAPDVIRPFEDADWIVNSRGTSDETVVRTLASLAGFRPTIAHRVDSLELVQDLLVAGLGIGLLPADQPTIEGVRLLPLSEPAVQLRAYAVTRGTASWAPLALVVRLLSDHTE